MADIVSPEQRSKNMSAIRSKDTRPEVYLRKLLFAQGVRYRIASKIYRGIQIYFSVNIIQLSSFTVVSGTAIRVVNTLTRQNPVWNSGKRNSIITPNGTPLFNMNYRVRE